MMQLLRTYMQRRRGFTMIEMLMVLLIVGTITAPLMLSLRNAASLTGPSAEATTTIARYSTADGFFARTMPVAERPLLQAYSNQMEFQASINGERRSYVVWANCTDPGNPTISMARLAPVRTNLVTNPSFELGTATWTKKSSLPDPEDDGWVDSDIEMTTVPIGTEAEPPAGQGYATQVAAGDRALRINRKFEQNSGWAQSGIIPVAPDQRYLLGGSYRSMLPENYLPGHFEPDQTGQWPEEKGASIQYVWVDRLGNIVNPGGAGWTERVFAEDGWVTRFVRTAPAPSAAAGLRVILSAGESAPGEEFAGGPNHSAFFDGIFLSADTTATNYFDGSMPFSVWNGAAHNSTSSQGQRHANTWPPPTTAPATTGMPAEALAPLGDPDICLPTTDLNYKALFTYLDSDGDPIPDSTERLSAAQVRVYMPPALTGNATNFAGASEQIYSLQAGSRLIPAAPIPNGSFEAATSLTDGWTATPEGSINTTEAVDGSNSLSLTVAAGGSGSAYNAAHWTAPQTAWSAARITFWVKRTGATTAIPDCTVRVDRDEDGVGTAGYTATTNSVAIGTPSWRWQSYSLNLPPITSADVDKRLRLRIALESVSGTGTGGCLFDQISVLQEGSR